MPAYAWLADAKVEASDVAPKMRALRRLGVPYSDQEIAGAAEALKDKTEMDAVIAYLQGLGTVLRDKR